MPIPGPAALGRGVVITCGSAVPEPWADARIISIDAATRTEPIKAVDALHSAWQERTPIVIELDVDPAIFRTPENIDDDPFLLLPSFEVWGDRLHFLVWANTYDARNPDDDPIWWWARKAERLGATATPDGPADIELADGRPAWVDGGPRSPLIAALATTDDTACVVHAESVDVERLQAIPAPAPPSAELAPDQLAAVSHSTGSARIIAPAGSGKTRVLTERLRHLVVDRGYERQNVLAVAYNKRAQLELEARCSDFQPRVQTLNALGQRLLADARGRSPQVLDERDVRSIIEKLVPTGRRRANTDPIGPYIEALSSIRLGLRHPEEVEDSRDDVPGLAQAFATYRAELASRGAIDFDEQIYGAIEALLRNGEFRRRAQASCRHLLVDEFQDLTPAHVLMLRLLASPQLDVFGVGDDDQVIYGHAGANPGFLVDFADYFPGADSHPLEVNYRCPAAVTAAAATLLGYNDRRVDKAIRSGELVSDDSAALEVVRHDPEDGATALAETVKAWLADGVAPSDIAVLTRVNSLLLAPHVVLAEAGISVNSALTPRVLERTGVRAALAYLRIAADPSSIEGADLIEVYRRPSRGFPNWITKWFKGRFTIDTVEAMAHGMEDAKVAAKIGSFASDLRAVARAAQGGTTRDVIAAIKDEVGLGGAMSMLDSSTGEGSSHLDDLEALEQVAALHPDVAAFEGWLREVFHRETAEAGVTLSTVHRVKGQEWPRVVLFGASGGLMPHRLADDIEEERRVFHVAITRGIGQVRVLADRERPSPFLDELDGSAPRDRKLAVRPSEIVPGSRLKKPRAASATGGPPLNADQQAVLDQLKEWRRARAKSDGVPAYVVLNDKYIEGIVRTNPDSLEKLLMCPGIGPSKLDRFGDEILQILEVANDK